MQSQPASNLDTPSPWWLTHSAKPLPAQTLCLSLQSALSKAYEFNAGGSVPIALVQVGTDIRLDAHQIKALWHEQGFPLPSS